MKQEKSEIRDFVKDKSYSVRVGRRGVYAVPTWKSSLPSDAEERRYWTGEPFPSRHWKSHLSVGVKFFPFKKDNGKGNVY